MSNDDGGASTEGMESLAELIAAKLHERTPSGDDSILTAQHGFVQQHDRALERIRERVKHVEDRVHRIADSYMNKDEVTLRALLITVAAFATLISIAVALLEIGRLLR